MKGMTVVSIPSFLGLKGTGRMYRMPSGRIAQVVDVLDRDPRQKTLTLRYLDNDEEVEVTKSFLNRCGRPA